MSAGSNRALGRAFFESQGGPDPSLCADGCVVQIGSNPAMDCVGHDAFARPFYEGCPDVYHQIEHVVAGDDAVAVHFTIHGTHTAPMWGIPATGRAIEFQALAFLTVEAGRWRD